MIWSISASELVPSPLGCTDILCRARSDLSFRPDYAKDVARTDAPTEKRKRMAETANPQQDTTLVELAADIVAAYVSHNSLSAAELPKLIGDIHNTLTSLGQPVAAEVEAPALTPAVSVRKSITPDYLICLDDGRKFKSLKRHLQTLGMTPDEYRTKWGLPKDYPMVAPNYSATRSELARQSGLGRKPTPEPEPTKSPRRRKAAA